MRNITIGHFRVRLSLHFKASLSAKSLLWKSVFIHIEIGTNYHNKSFALRLALKERLRRTRKWPIFRRPEQNYNQCISSGCDCITWVATQLQVITMQAVINGNGAANCTLHNKNKLKELLFKTKWHESTTLCDWLLTENPWFYHDLTAVTLESQNDAQAGANQMEPLSSLISWVN